MSGRVERFRVKTRMLIHTGVEIEGALGRVQRVPEGMVTIADVVGLDVALSILKDFADRISYYESVLKGSGGKL